MSDEGTPGSARDARISDQEREAWQAACDAATPGPWVDTMGNINRHSPAMGAIYAGIGPVHEGDTEAAYLQATHDSAFITIARTALPRLLAAWDTQERTIDSLRDECTLVHGANRNLAAELDAAHDEALRWRESALAWRATYNRWASSPQRPPPSPEALADLQAQLDALQATQPPLPDPTAPQQLGLLEDGA